MFHQRLDSSYFPPKRPSVSLVALTVRRFGDTGGSLPLLGELSASGAARTVSSVQLTSLSA